jgi:D-lactate dehydrogenase
MLSGKYKNLYEILTGTIDKKRIFHDPLHTLAYGTDASFYRLIPKLVIRANDEKEVSLILSECSKLNIAVTFRAAGTSLSGQAISDSVLLIAGSNWKGFDITGEGLRIELQPGLTGGRVNSLLARYGRKIGPDPASVNSAMIGGIVANNASGMCCGTSQNSYRTVRGIKIIFRDGTILDTLDELSKESFRKNNPAFISEIDDIAKSARSNPVLAERIRKKYKMKNTTGYSLNALIDFTDPIDIIEHLMIGSEGTLGFIASVTFETVVEHSFKASSLMLFPDIENACRAVSLLKKTAVSAVELIDRSGLRSVENEKGMPGFLEQLGDEVCALLVETVDSDALKLNENINLIVDTIKGIPTVRPVEFTDVASNYEQLWKIRKGLFPSVGAMRKTGTTVIIEDVAFPIDSLAAATLDLQMILKKYSYSEAVIFGHALEGNLHFVFTQDFSTKVEIERYGNLMNDVSDLVVNKYDGSLKAEHGTGRNMAPFVEMEWGKDAFILMKRIKSAFDPDNILNPGVILNEDKNSHLHFLKPIPEANEIIDKCTECGFCEPACVSSGLTLTPRQRIVIHREMVSLARTGKEPHIAASLAKSFKYQGNETCATDGLCATVCPVKIDTGKLVKNLRKQKIGRNQSVAYWLARRMSLATGSARLVLKIVNFFHLILGTKLMAAISSAARTISFKTIPKWNKYMPSGASVIQTGTLVNSENPDKVVYFPSCINRSMGVSAEHRNEKQLSETLISLIRKAGFEVIFPDNIKKLCCGMAFLSKGYTKAGELKSAELENELLKASENGRYPVLCDMSPCLFTMRENMKKGLKLYEPVEFIIDYLLPHLEIKPVNETIALFPVCSIKKMGLEKKLEYLASLCAKKVIVADTNCCGFAGDRGFTFPELNSHGLMNLKSQLPPEIIHGYSTSRTCEIGLSENTEISFKSIIYLVDSTSCPLPPKGSSVTL